MTEHLGIAICTYGSQEWDDRGHALFEKVLHDTSRWLPPPGLETVIAHIHGDSLADARNRAAREVDADWLCYLDADDDLAPNYASAMGRAATRWATTPALIQPGTIFRAPPGTETPALDALGLIPPHPAGLLTGNHLIIGTAVPRQLVLDVGGWDDTLPVLEDWDLWIRCWRAGATITTCPTAIYIANINPDGRNLRLGPAERARWAQTIRRRYA